MSTSAIMDRQRVSEAPVRTEGIDVPRVLGRVDGPDLGPTLIVIGGLHGNEPAGVLALQRILSRLGTESEGLRRGRLVGLAGNRKALKAKRRYLAHDLNRCWLPGRVTRLRASSGPLEAEDEEMRELDKEIAHQLFEARETVYLLDLHTTSGPKLPFATHDDTLRNRPFAFAFPVPVVLGLEEELVGTLSSYVGSLGVITTGFESGQHDAEAAVDRAESAIWIALEASGVLTEGSRPEVAAAHSRLGEECRGLPHVVEVRHRHAIAPDDVYRTNPGYENFQSVTAGEPIGEDRRGPVHSPVSGRILMPLYQEQGAEGYFVVRQVHRMWLEASAVVRRWRFERLLHLLPGVRRHPELPGSFLVDRRYARWLALELFHLLGFKRLGDADRVLIMSRRLHDRSQ